MHLHLRACAVFMVRSCIMHDSRMKLGLAAKHLSSHHALHLQFHVASQSSSTALGVVKGSGVFVWQPRLWQV
jgi:hypothetical protein